MKHPTRLGRYEIVGLLGHGGMGAVYKAHDPVLDRFVAVKRISPIVPAAGTDDEALQRFRREARAAGKLSHPNIVSVYDMDVDEATETPFIVMECVDGITLSTVLSENPRMPVSQALEIIDQVGAALAEAHEHGIVHRDVKPANVFLDSRGRVKVGDFGIARVQGSDLTQAGVALGTPGYLAPEVLHGAPADPRSDVFALGVLAYQLLAGKRPFDGPTPAAITLDVVQRMPDPPRVLRPEIPPHVSAAVMRTLDKSAATRTPSVQTFLRSLRESPTVVPAPTIPVAATGGGARLAAAALAGALTFGAGAVLLARGCAPAGQTEIASPPRKAAPVAVLDDEPATTRRATPSRTLPPVATRRPVSEEDGDAEAEPTAGRPPQTERTREDELRRRGEEAAAGWVRDRLGDILHRGSRDDKDDWKRDEKEREEREKDREKEREGKGKGRKKD